VNPPAHPNDRAILNYETGMSKFTLERFDPAPDLAPFVDQYWVVRWDLRGQAPYCQTILSFPNVNISFEQDHNGRFAGVYGVPKATYTRHLQDVGMTLGVKFRPGGFYPFWRQPVSLLTGQVRSIRDTLHTNTAELEERIASEESGERKARFAEQFLRELTPQPDEQVELVSRIVQAVIDDRDMLKVEDMVEQFGIGKRTLQRLFSRYVGVSPKWVIQRYRLQEAADVMAKGTIPDWATLCQNLGYYDQAHFIKDFKAMIGKSPEEYRKEIGRPRLQD
jgi:AraC-like DNA-binding protein